MFCSPEGVAIIYLRISPSAGSVELPTCRAPTKIWVSSLWGLPSFHLWLFTKARLCGTLWILWPLTSISPPSPVRCLDLLVCLAQTLQTSQSVLAWTFLTPEGARLPDGLIILLYHISYCFSDSRIAFRDKSTRPLSSIPMTLTVMTSPSFTTSSTRLTRSLANLEIWTNPS